MRITGGAARGIVLSVDKSHGVRPATDRMREALFSSLGSLVEGALFLDLFAGSGSYGLEALSRGAAGGTFIERDSRVTRVLNTNLQAVCKSIGHNISNCEILQMDVFQLKELSPEKFDLIFADPPYQKFSELHVKLFSAAASWIRPRESSRLILEMPGGSEPAHEGWGLMREFGGKSRGDPTVSVYRRLPDPCP